ncbi:MAG: hypothetical protein EVA97_00560 [SAR86 cluster bacterium]|uniref:Uncharacterized protein n=1 Tax=SAR86 cluster bacterium TaxID=2030880 RepID=A0A520N6T5_9GAMM|nr:MAG: hypothetical protein EVA97_00560 [SAR86 cluster bacterium]|tara:strand:- start:7963 stop:8610 length:648 start_codon:yes stop_codon:yes gene_type:complete
MKTKILVIGYGDIAERLNHQLDKSAFDVFGISRQENNACNSIIWDWLSSDLPKLKNKEYSSIVFFPKPSDTNQNGYVDGFINSSKNVFNLCNTISFKNFITISSTRIYGEKENNSVTESDSNPNEFRGKTILKYEESQIKRYAEKLIILRFSGLYNSKTEMKPKNYLHRENAAKIIKFFIENDLSSTTHQIFNCCEDGSINISNERLKKVGFIFD